MRLSIQIVSRRCSQFVNTQIWKVDYRARERHTHKSAYNPCVHCSQAMDDEVRRLTDELKDMAASKGTALSKQREKMELDMMVNLRTVEEHAAKHVQSIQENLRKKMDESATLKQELHIATSRSASTFSFADPVCNFKRFWQQMWHRLCVEVIRGLPLCGMIKIYRI
jgi:hypothetical protein